MTFDEYISRYRMLQLSVENNSRLENILNDENYLSFIERIKKGVGANQKELNIILPYERIVKKQAKYQKLASRYALRIARACELIDDPPVREYAMLRYVYGITNDKIAETSFYSLRSVYRHGTLARKELSKYLLKVMPKIRKIKYQKFYCNKKLRLRNYSVSKEVQRKIGISRGTTAEAITFRISNNNNKDRAC